MAPCTRSHSPKFTLIELLVVVAIISVLASILLPVLGKARSKSRSILCVNNLKQMGLTMSLYADDYDGFLPSLSSVAAKEHWMAGYFLYQATGTPLHGAGQVSTSRGFPDIWKCPSMDLINILANKTQYSGGFVTLANVRPNGGASTTISDWYGYGVNGLNRTIGLDDSAGRSWKKLDAGYPEVTVHLADFHFFEQLHTRSTPATYVYGQRGGLRHDGGKNWLYFDGHVQYLKLQEVPTDLTNHFWADNKYE